MTLLWLLLLPFIGGLLCWLLERFGVGLVRWIALLTMLAVVALAANLWCTGDYSLTLLDAAGHAGGRWTQQFSVPWMPRFGIHFSLGLDGLSLLWSRSPACSGQWRWRVPGTRSRARWVSFI